MPVSNTPEQHFPTLERIQSPVVIPFDWHVGRDLWYLKLQSPGQNKHGLEF